MSVAKSHIYVFILKLVNVYMLKISDKINWDDFK